MRPTRRPGPGPADVFRFFPCRGRGRSRSSSTASMRATPSACCRFIAALAMLEQMGLAKRVDRLPVLLATVALYAGIGMLSAAPPTRTNTSWPAGGAGDLQRRWPRRRDWMSAASFISLAGTLYLQGYDGLAYIIGLDGRLPPRGVAAGAVPAQVRPATPSPISSASAMAATSARVRRRWWPPCCARSCTWWRRSTAWA